MPRLEPSHQGGKSYKRRRRARIALAQEAEQERRAAPRDGARAALQEREQEAEVAPRDPEQLDGLGLQEQGREAEAEVAPWQIDPDLVDDYTSVPFVATIHSILFEFDPRYNVSGIHDGIEHGGYRRALKKLPDIPAPHSELGMRVAGNRARMLERLGRHEEAEALYRDLADELPDNSNAHLNLARVLDHLGRREESAEALSRACWCDSHPRRAFEAGMRPDPRQLDPAAVPLRLIIPMSVISAAGTMHSRAELSAMSRLVQAECGLDMYPPSVSRMPGCAGIGADMERFHHLVVEDVLLVSCAPGEQPYYYDLTDTGIEMIGRLGERLGGNAEARIGASARRVAGIGAHAALEEACRGAGEAARQAGAGRAGALAGIRGTADRIRREIGNGILFGDSHAFKLEAMAKHVPDMLSQACDAPDAQWSVATALGRDILGLCAYVAFDQRPHPRTASQGPPYPDIQDLYALLVRYCGEKGMAEPRFEIPTIRDLTPDEIEEITRDMLKVISES